MIEQKKSYEFKFKQNASYDLSQQDSYETLKKQKDSFLYGDKMTNTFILAMALGYKNNAHKKILKPSNSIPTEKFSEGDIWMMVALYMQTKNKNLDALYDTDKILENAEEYANGGIDYLYTLYRKSKNPIEDLEAEFRQELK